ncbi:biotin/lipoyl-containing protein, partial [Acidithiobacillus sulfurivorans]
MAEPYVIKMPQLTDTMTEGVVVSWEKPIGARVERGDVVATIETDKAIMDVEVFRSGYLAGPLAAVDSVMPVGAAMAYLTETSDEAVSPVQDAPAKTAPAVASEPTESEALSGHAIKMPQLSDTMTEGVLVSWEKSLGDKIQRGDVVATIETDKAIMDVEVFREGYLSGPRVAVDAVVPVGDPIAWLVETADQVREAGTVSGSRPEVSAAAVDKTPSASTVSTQPPVAQHLSARVPGAQPAPRPQQGAASPFARQLAGQQGVDLNHLQGSGPAGVIVAADVIAAAG